MGLDVQLFDRLDRDEAHPWPAHGPADGFGIVGVVLVAFDVGFHELRGDQFDRVTHLGEDPRPVVGAGAGFHADQARGQGLEKAHLLALGLTRQHTLVVGIHAEHLKDILGQIKADTRNLHGGLLLSD